MTLYRVECSCLDFSACTRNAVEAAKLKLLHSTWNADIKRGTDSPHRVKVTAANDYARAENQALLEVLA